MPHTTARRNCQPPLGRNRRCIGYAAVGSLAGMHVRVPTWHLTGRRSTGEPLVWPVKASPSRCPSRRPPSFGAFWPAGREIGVVAPAPLTHSLTDMAHSHAHSSGRAKVCCESYLQSRLETATRPVIDVGFRELEPEPYRSLHAFLVAKHTVIGMQDKVREAWKSVVCALSYAHGAWHRGTVCVQRQQSAPCLL